jgi:ABC-type transport system involved in multi-copper enzyme maturation permease subunit
VTWVTWRQHRIEVVTAATLLAALSIALLYSTWELSQVRQSLNGLSETAQLSSLSDQAGLIMTAIPAVLLVLPALVGIFIGAPLFARDLEQGTHQLLWTQSITRRRWLLVTLLIVLAPVLACAAIVAILAVRWVNVQGTLTNPWYAYDEQGLVLVAYTAFAFALGAAFGVLIRRVVPAMAATAALFVAVRVVFEVVLRPSLMTPEKIDQNMPIPDGSWVVSTGYTDEFGRQLTSDQVAQVMQTAGRLPSTVADYLHSLGIQAWVYYQPADRFWVFQGIEAGLFFILAIALIALSAVWVVRRSS